MDFTLNEDSSLDFELTSFDVEGAEVSYSIITSPLYGSLEFLGDSNYRYIPDFNYFGLDSFTFNVSDGFLNSNIAEINLEVLGINDPPIGTTFNIITDEDQIYSFKYQMLLMLIMMIKNFLLYYYQIVHLEHLNLMAFQEFLPQLIIYLALIVLIFKSTMGFLYLKYIRLLLL